MKDTALYEQLLGLKSPWSIKKVDLSLLAEQRVVVEVILNKGQVWADPTDATKMAHVNGWSERQWRHLDTCQFETVIRHVFLSSNTATARLKVKAQIAPPADIQFPTLATGDIFSIPPSAEMGTSPDAWYTF